MSAKLTMAQVQAMVASMLQANGTTVAQPEAKPVKTVVPSTPSLKDTAKAPVTPTKPKAGKGKPVAKKAKPSKVHPAEMLDGVADEMSMLDDLSRRLKTVDAKVVSALPRETKRAFRRYCFAVSYLTEAWESATASFAEAGIDPLAE